MEKSETPAYAFVSPDEVQRRREQSEHRRGLRDWLEGPAWTHVFTGSFPQAISPFICMKIARRFVLSFQKRGTVDFAVGVASTNNGSSKVHLHALLKAPGLASAELELGWHDKTHGTAVCTTYNPTGEAEGYLLKQWDSEHWDVLTP